MVKMNWYRFLLAIMYMVSQNNFYGWNKTPQSDMEILTDGIGMILLSLALVWEKKS